MENSGQTAAQVAPAFAGDQRLVAQASTTVTLGTSPKAKAMLKKLSAQNRFALAFRLHNLKIEAGREKKIADFIAMLERGETIHPQKL
jgi:ABC-type microcin C transport system duplicated ATPase subunit YejF